MYFRNNYNHTIRASYIGYIVQAIINNFAPLLFVTFQNKYNISLDRISLLITVNFGVQLLIDLLSSKLVDKVGYRVAVVFADAVSSIGLLMLSFLPEILPDAYTGIMISIVLCAVGGGLLEVVISPIVEASPCDNKEAHMSLLHSFYCWGHVAVVLISTAYFAVFGIENWHYLALAWTVVPIINMLYFLVVPITTLNKDCESTSFKKLFSVKLFWVLALLMLCAGACELSVSQWASAFAEKGLGVSKTIGDLTGPLSFAALMGISRVIYAKISERVNLEKYMFASVILCVASYLLISLSPVPLFSLVGCALCGMSVGVLWPGTYSIAAKELRTGGTAMFALLALAGDMGCSSGPTLVGIVSGAYDDNLDIGMLAAIVFPLLMLVGIALCKKVKNENRH